MCTLGWVWKLKRGGRTVRPAPENGPNAPLMIGANIDNLLRAIELHQYDLHTPSTILNGCKNAQDKTNLTPKKIKQKIPVACKKQCLQKWRCKRHILRANAIKYYHLSCRCVCYCRSVIAVNGGVTINNARHLPVTVLIVWEFCKPFIWNIMDKTVLSLLINGCSFVV